MSDTSDALQAMLDSEGWRLFREHVKAEWAPSRCWVRVKENGGDLDKIDYTNVQVGHLMDWPAVTIAAEKRTEAQNQTRGMIPMGRRGGL